MATPWFFATTPAPHPAAPERHVRRDGAWRQWWQRAGARIVALGEGATHHRMGSWEATARGIDPYNGSSVK